MAGSYSYGDLCRVSLRGGHAINYPAIFSHASRADGTPEPQIAEITSLLSRNLRLGDSIQPICVSQFT